MQKTTPFLSKNPLDQSEEQTNTDKKTVQDKKAALLDISVWSEEDIEVIRQAQKEINKWTIISVSD